jgi:hypothetical protein
MIGEQPSYWNNSNQNEGARFFLKARKVDEPGQGISIHIMGDEKHFSSIFRKSRDIGENPLNPILVTGTLNVFEAPTNTGLLIGIFLDVGSPDAIKILGD